LTEAVGRLRIPQAQDQRRRGFRATACLLLALQGTALATGALTPRAVVAQAAFSPLVRQGSQLWNEERCGEAVETLRKALKDPGLMKGDRVIALRVIAQCHVRLGDEASAIGAFHELLNIERDWEPDPNVLLPDELDLFINQAKPTWKPPAPPRRSLWKNPWVLGAGGLVTVGVVALIAGGGSGDETTRLQLPLPPQPPSGD
jgi:hypothetical protein